MEIIGNLDAGGYLRAGINDIAAQLDVMSLDVERVLDKVQEFDPAGVAARTLSECLLRQLNNQGRKYSTEARIVKHYLDELGRKKLHEIAKALDLEITEIQHAAEVIAQLDPMPGRAFSPDTNQIVTPEVLIENDGDGYSVSLNSDEIPGSEFRMITKTCSPAPLRRFEIIFGIKYEEGLFHQKHPTTSADDIEHRSRNRHPAKGIHGPRRSPSKADDNEPGRRSRRGARNHRQPSRRRKVHGYASGNFRDEIFLHPRLHE